MGQNCPKTTPIASDQGRMACESGEEILKSPENPGFLRHKPTLCCGSPLECPRIISTDLDGLFCKTHLALGA
jgi:hypothetical protein